MMNLLEKKTVSKFAFVKINHLRQKVSEVYVYRKCINDTIRFEYTITSLYVHTAIQTLIQV